MIYFIEIFHGQHTVVLYCNQILKNKTKRLSTDLQSAQNRINSMEVQAVTNTSSEHSTADPLTKAKQQSLLICALD